MKKSIRLIVAVMMLFVGSSAVATQFDGPDEPPPLCLPNTVCP